ncbi:zinc finger CCCH-type with G patch domain-containing protein-like [Mizuhopecten yessoensis]|uniref:Zinc finger CCCH-type with G patch domain-containing protein n=1 Tax=Mizuhopecten yessoensis TaxID=6573 RepID=A0A210Q1P6_MIZYE|nr:zinc finger CCCH-type with G patch domain-containing protein-like [Mizuhopecten yessoensis]OWF42647.1 Zinc finger CCCH-type with G patch domain-containing protein [Mizuhopecten yessoensis]
MDESSIESSLELYKSQLSQVDQALCASGENADLLKLQSDLKELIHLTEESLLSLKKSIILKSLEEDAHVTGEETPHGSNDLDSEYAAFQAMLSEDVSDPNENSTQTASDSPGHVALPQQTDEELKQMIGMKCRAPFVHEWGALSCHNAIISGLIPATSTDLMPKVTVMFCNPTHMSMLPCTYHLEGNCKFSDQKCRFSHGHIVELDDLREFQDPDYSALTLGSRCLAQYDDDLWYKAMVVDLHDDHQYSVTMDTYEGVHQLDLKHIIPLEQSEEMSDEEENAEDDIRSAVPSPALSDDDELDIPVYLWKPPQSSQTLGNWEAHTKGIGSKLMAKMGYVLGQGLGKREDGRVEPVPIQLLPPGKSLDTIMLLKELAGEQDLFDVMKKKEKKQKAQEKKQAQAYEKMKTEDQNVFDFMNRRLGGKKGNLKDLVSHDQNKPSSESSSSSANRNISEQDLKAKSERHLNIQLMKTDEEIKNVKRELEKLKVSLARNELRDKNMASRVRQKITSTENYLQRLMTSGSAIQQHKQNRFNHKKLTVF